MNLNSSNKTLIPYIKTKNLKVAIDLQVFLLHIFNYKDNLVR